MHAITLIVILAAAVAPGSLVSVTDGKESIYSYIYSGICRPNIIARSNKNITLDGIANSGDFNFAYVTGYAAIACGKTEFHGDSEIGYRRTVTLLDNKGKTTVQHYRVTQISPGVFMETFRNINRMAKLYTNTYKLIIMSWDKELGVLHYVRCSDDGRKDADDRYIVVNSCTTGPDSPSLQKAEQFYEADNSMGFIGRPIHPITQC